MNFAKKYWIGISAIFVIGIFGFFIYRGYEGYYPFAERGVGETAGKAFGYAFIFFFIGNSLRKRIKIKRLEFWFLCFAIPFALCGVFNVVNARKQVGYLNKCNQEVVRAVNESSAGLLSLKPSYSSEEYGEWVKFLSIIRQAAEVTEKTQVDMNEVLSKFSDILNIPNLCDQKHIIRSISNLNDLTARFDEIERQYNENLIQIKSNIKKSYARDSYLLNVALKEMKTGKSESQKLMTEYFHIERCCFQQVSKMLNFLSKKAGTFWELDDGSLAFENGDDVDAHNLLIQNFMEYAQEEEDILRRLKLYKSMSIQSIEKDLERF